MVKEKIMKENIKAVVVRKTDYQALIAPYRDTAFANLKRLVAIDSTYDSKTKTAEHPFGIGVDRALKYVADLGATMGFQVNRCDNYVTELTYGSGSKVLDIYAHCDVVSVNKEQWIHDPFALTLSPQKMMYGRGTNDDKGPGLACLFAVKALIDSHRLFGFRLRFLFGGNEENDSLCLKHYFEEMKRPYPTIGFSPDADFPLIYGEKSIYAYEADYAIDLPEVAPFSLGNALNIVLSDAVITLKKPSKDIATELAKYLKKYPQVSATFAQGVLSFQGKPSHGSLPWNGVNAGLHLLNFLGQVYEKPILQKIFTDYEDGKGIAFGGNFKNKYFSCSSYNVGRVSFDGENVKISVNLRFPAGLDVNKVIANVTKKTKAEVTLLGGSEGFVADPKSAFIQTLLKAYQDETGDTKSKPLAIGGGTYARESKNSVAFGAAFPGRECRMHGNDEFYPLGDFEAAMQIYAHAVDALASYLRTDTHGTDK
jgi:succinyl-diaminopimelate desuccinylase